MLPHYFCIKHAVFHTLCLNRYVTLPSQSFTDYNAEHQSTKAMHYSIEHQTTYSVLTREQEKNLVTEEVQTFF